jgi:hypothetical protein
MLVFQIVAAWCAASLAVGALWIVVAMARSRPGATITPADDAQRLHAERRAAGSSAP